MPVEVLPDGKLFLAQVPDDDDRVGSARRADAGENLLVVGLRLADHQGLRPGRAGPNGSSGPRRPRRRAAEIGRKETLVLFDRHHSRPIGANHVTHGPFQFLDGLQRRDGLGAGRPSLLGLRNQMDDKDEDEAKDALPQSVHQVAGQVKDIGRGMSAAPCRPRPPSQMIAGGSC